MKKVVLLLCAGTVLHTSLHAQGFLKKLKNKAEQKLESAVDKKVDEKTGTNTSSNNSSNSDNNVNTGSSNNSSSHGRPVNKGGEGLKNTTPPDVTQQIKDAEQAYASKNYGDARYSVQQALLGVEVQMGNQILKSLPNEVSGLPKDTLQDRVMSTHWGWANLTMLRVYVKDDKQLSITIGNNTAYAGMLDFYFNSNMVQSNGETQNLKQIRIKGNKAIIKYDEHDGYTILMQLGQSGLITWQGINYANEQEITAAANAFDVDSIKKTLGEQ